MGSYLSSPKTQKTTETKRSGILQCAGSQMQGWRMTMQDAKLMELNLPGNSSCFGVFDGHGGHQVAVFVARHFTQQLTQNINYSSNPQTALQQTFLKMDDLLLLPSGQQELIRIQRDLPNNYVINQQKAQTMAGCTSVVAFVQNNEIWVANAGDSRAVLSRRGQAVELSYDHKPENEEEFARITRAGGYVQDGRVMGNINLSRSIGDFEYKNSSNLPPQEQMLTAFPDVKMERITPDTDFMVIACDGIWDMVTNQECVDFVQKAMQSGAGLGKIVESLLDRCLAPDIASHGGLGCDNMTCIIVKFNH